MSKKTTRKAARSSSFNGGASQKLVWEEPPPKARSGRAFNFPSEELKKNKNSWAKIHACETSKQAGGRAGAIKASLKKREMAGFEVMSRGSDVFARFTGK